MPTVTQLRLIYFCRSDDLRCCGCNKPLRYAATKGADFDLVTCVNGRGGQHCGERLLLLPGTKRTTIVRLTKAEAAIIADRTRDTEAGRRANDVLRDIGVLVETVSELERAG